MKAFITGINGFQGSHLAKYLTDQGDDVYGFNRVSDTGNLISTRASHVFTGDIAVGHHIQNALTEVKPDVIYHLAALITGRNDETTLESLMQTNVTGTMKLLKAARDCDSDPIIINIGSSAEYGNISVEQQPITEESIFQPVNYYAISKISQEMAMIQAWHEHRQKIIRACVFNIIGPGQVEHLVPATFARQIVDIEKDSREPVIHVGNLHSYRDITDVRDIVKAYYLLTKYGTPGEKYNICSGKPTLIRSLLDELIDLSGMAIQIEEKSSRLRKSDIPTQTGSANKIRQQTSWQPQISIQQSLLDTLQEQRLLVEKTSN
jgi:GDP-4-dehydro-6-deoxy-D-mannose reductase